MFMGFIIHFYITFGTNLLTGGPAQNCCFLAILGFRRKGISNGVQMEWNLWERGFLTERDPGHLDPTPRRNRGGHEGGGAPSPRGARGTLLAASLVSWLPLQVLWITFVSKRSIAKVSFRLDPVWYSFSLKHWNRQKNSNTGWASG